MRSKRDKYIYIIHRVNEKSVANCKTQSNSKRFCSDSENSCQIINSLII